MSLLIKIWKKIFPIKPERFYNIDGFILDMGASHNLSIYQKEHPMYDRFIPFLGEIADNCSKEGTWIIDIGANVGDTVAALLKHTRQNVFCIEPTKEFFHLCEKNIETFGEINTKRVILLNAYIAIDAGETYHSKITNGTATKVKDINEAMEAPTYTLPMALQKKEILLEQVSLIKVDTDGYDAECIMSLGDKLKESKVLLYWENLIEEKEHYDKYANLVDYLKNVGYDDFFVFDNFGNYLCKVDSTGLYNLNNYLLRVMNRRSARTFYYIDVLACKKDQVEICISNIEKYVAKYDI